MKTDCVRSPRVAKIKENIENAIMLDENLKRTKVSSQVPVYSSLDERLITINDVSEFSVSGLLQELYVNVELEETERFIITNH